MDYIWIFNGENSRFGSGAFSTLTKAEEWISKNKLTGVLTRYPVDMGVYEWAIAHDLFSVKKEEHLQSSFIGKFTSASQEHFHYENGARE
ncbi:hypothetical protein MKQ70_11735 [Chitinophaga sedimenti]|uniref:DUF7710 domain-containing protein n=1 Tax=Chitinophaga sedimenti TaxID=2033606 RepID=UPI002002B877|nr:hypothetical protein [Chitinophaga sedimenti]MCK7555648.1 hypothetical protein [Chitinophaga sedimenti]